MSKTDIERNLEARAELFKALGHLVRLLILNLVRMQPRHGQELAEILRLNPATVSHHLTKLSEAGLLTAEKDQYYQTYSLVGGALEKSLTEMVFLPQPGLKASVAEDAFRVKVLDTFFKHGRLLQIPAQRKKQLIIYEKLAEEFEPGREYSEREVNLILVEFNEDVAQLRRSLIDFGFLTRNQGIYQRVTKD